MAGKSFRDKLADDKDLPRVEALQGGMRARHGKGTIVLPSAREIDELMRRVKKGRVTTINAIRLHLAARHGVTMACPIVTGIHARIAAGAAGEDEADGKTRITPYWRTLKAKGEINDKYPGGLAGQRRRLEAEGFTVVPRGKRLFVLDFEKKMADLGA